MTWGAWIEDLIRKLKGRGVVEGDVDIYCRTLDLAFTEDGQSFWTVKWQICVLEDLRDLGEELLLELLSRIRDQAQVDLFCKKIYQGELSERLGLPS